MNHTVIPVILCGGSGTRLWPASRERFPKQFLKLIGGNSLLQETAQRAHAITGAPWDNLLTVTLGALGDQVRTQLAEIDPVAARHILSEPCARNTAAAVAFAALYIRAHFGKDAFVWILPADHHIGHTNVLAEAFHEGLAAAGDGHLVTFGIQPTRPETGYGYIRSGDRLGERGFKVDSFVEKPDLNTAKAYLDSGDYLWNSGMFLFRAGDVLNEFDVLAKDILSGVEKAMASGEENAPDAARYNAIPSEPFDKAILEKSGKVAVVPCNPDWSDIGSWESLWEIRAKDGNGNVTEGEVVYESTHNCLIQSRDRLIACAGLENIVAIDTGDAILIADRRNGDAIKALVSEMKKRGRTELIDPPPEDSLGDRNNR